MSDRQEPSPYAPPASMLVEPPLDPAELVAGRGRRLGNLVVDALARGFLSMVVAVIAPNRSLPAALFEALLMALGYYIVLESAFGWTLGKLVTGTRVVADDGGRASVLQCVGRSFSRLIPFEPLSFLFGGAPVGWHDSLPGTRVIRVR